MSKAEQELNKKLCSLCGVEKLTSEFHCHPETLDGLQSYCKECGLVMSNRYYQQNLEAERLQARERYHQNPSRQRVEREAIKAEVLTHYGGGTLACVRCGFSDIRALSIDHISGNGTEEKKRLGRAGTEFYRWLRQNLYPKGYQTLCMNCQFIKREENKEYNQWTKKGS